MTTPATLVQLYAEEERLSAEFRRLREEATELWAASQVIIAESHRLAQESSALGRQRMWLTPACGFLGWTDGPQLRWAWRKRSWRQSQSPLVIERALLRAGWQPTIHYRY